MSTGVVTFEVDHGGSVIRIVGNRKGLRALAEEISALVDQYQDGQTLPLLNDSLAIARGGTDIAELVCDDSILSEGRS